MNINCYSDIYKKDISLRPYQEKAKKDIFESWDEVDNVMFQMPTGTGKTRLFTSIIRDINDYSKLRREPVKILIIAHRTELIDQIDESLRKYMVPHNVIAGGRDRNYKYPVNVASIQTITHPNNLNDAKKLNVQFIIIDEAHHALAATYKKLWNLYPGSKKLGVTATPWRMNHQSFLDLFDKLVLSMPIKDFINQGYLAPYKYFSLRGNSDIQKTIDDIELDRFGEYKESSMEEKMDIGSIRAQLLDSYLSLAEGKKGIIYAINIVHAKHICEEYKKAGYTAVSIDSKTPASERKDLVYKFRRGLIDIIVNVDIFSEGFDCPDIEFIQLARPTRSLVKYLQQVGRGLRPTENKQECVILDNVGMYSRFGLPNARRHWKQHFLGKNVEEEPVRAISKGTGKSRFIDLSEGTEDMELIQDVNDEVDAKEIPNDSLEVSSTAINEFFPLFGITLGKTTWKQAKELGYIVEKWEDGPARHATVEEVAFWDHEGEGKFTSLYWVQDENDFPPLWQSKGFSWNLSFDEWLGVFKEMGYKIEVVKEPRQKKYHGRDTLSAEFEALSPDGALLFDLDFNYGEDGYLTSSPKTLYAITVDYQGSIEEAQSISENETHIEENQPTNVEIIDNPFKEEPFDPMPKLLENNYVNDNFVFWADDERVYEAYIQDDKYFIISELIVNEVEHCVHRYRVGKIPMDSWMFWQMDREKVDNLKSINHLGANFTVFHYQVLQSENTFKDKYFDYKGNEIDSPSVVEEKYNKERNISSLFDYIDVPVSKATFDVEILSRSSKISVSRTIKGVTKLIAIFPLLSDFGRKYYDLDSLISKIGKNKNLSSDAYNRIKKSPSETCQIYRSDIKSFTARCGEGGKVFLYKYDFNGKLIKKGTLADKDEDKNSPLTDADINKLWHVFDSKATSYKYFWFLSILQLFKEEKQVSIMFKQILARMIANAWKYVCKGDCEFPKADQIPKLVDVILAKYMLDDSSDMKKVESQILYYYERSHLDHLLSPLLKNVPYRFLSPWIPFTDNADVIAKSIHKDSRCLYGLYDDHIAINPVWSNYLIDNYDKIMQFIENGLRNYLNCKETSIKRPRHTSSSIEDFFPLFGVTLGKTTWKQVEDMGAEVEIWKGGPSRTTEIEGVDFWDHEGEGIFTSLYWTVFNRDFPPLWKSKGFSWNLSYDEWMALFRKMRFQVKIKQLPIQKEYSGRNTLSARVEALSSDGMLLFDLNFSYGENGYLKSSPKTLYSITVTYKK